MNPYEATDPYGFYQPLQGRYNPPLYPPTQQLFHTPNQPRFFLPMSSNAMQMAFQPPMAIQVPFQPPMQVPFQPPLPVPFQPPMQMALQPQIEVPLQSLSQSTSQTPLKQPRPQFKKAQKRKMNELQRLKKKIRILETTSRPLQPVTRPNDAPPIVPLNVPPIEPLATYSECPTMVVLV